MKTLFVILVGCCALLAYLVILLKSAAAVMPFETVVACGLVLCVPVSLIAEELGHPNCAKVFTFTAMIVSAGMHFMSLKDAAAV